MATVDLGGDTLIVGSVVTGVSTPGSGQIGNPNLVGAEIGGFLFAAQTANYLTTSTTAMTTAQKVFNVSTNGAVTVATNQNYMFEGMYTYTVATNNTHSYQVLFGGNATVASIGYQLYVTSSTASGTATTQTLSAFVSTAGASPASPIQTASGEVTNFFLNGMVSFNGGGTFIPQFQLAQSGAATVPTTSVTLAKGSYFGMWPIGNATQQTVGSWS